MALAESDPISEALRHFERLSPLGDRDPATLAGDVALLQAAAGDLLLALGSDDSRQLFLLEGELELVAGDNARHRVRASDPAARAPLSRLRPSRYRVSAISDVRYLMVEQHLLEGCVEPGCGPGMVVEESYPLGEISELIDDSATHPVMFDILDDFNHDRIVVPLDPAIAVRVGAALAAAGDDSERLAKVIAICPALTLRAVRAAMAADPTAGPIQGCRQAVDLLGAEKLYAMAANCVLRESLRTRADGVAKRMHEWWQRTMRVAAICRVLARMSERFDPDYATLIGLLHAIAEPIVLGYADRHRDLDDAVALDNVVHDNRGELGRMLTTAWGLPRAVREAATLCNHWEYDHPGDADYTDIVLVAQWHATLGVPDGRRRRPGSDRIPAFRRLGLADASPEVSLRIIEAADNAIERGERLLGGGPTRQAPR
jgi:HD-like signal output (HDOD) protein